MVTEAGGDLSVFALGRGMQMLLDQSYVSCLCPSRNLWLY